MNNFKFYGWFSKILNVVISIFLVFTLLSSLYTFCYLFNDSIRSIAFVVLSIITILFIIIFKKKIRQFLDNLFIRLDNISNTKMLVILILILVVLKVFYSLVFYFDPSTTNDIISEYIRLTKNYVNNGILTKTIGDSFVALVLNLSIFEKLHIPYHIGMFVLILVSIVVLFESFKNSIGKSKIFLACLLYSLMPSTILLSFCPTFEVFTIFYVSLLIFILSRLMLCNKTWKEVLYTILLVLIVMILRCFGVVGYALIIIFAITLVLTNCNSKKRYFITVILILSVVINNIFYYGISYNWRNKEYLYQGLIHGSNIESDGRFVENYVNDYLDEYLITNGLEGTHENQEAAYFEAISDNYTNLINNPKDAFKLLVNKYYVSFSGDHYPIEMLNNSKSINDTVYYALLGLNELVYILVIVIGLASSKADSDINIGVSQLLLIMTSIVLLIGESQNRYSLFLTPLIYMICFSRHNKEA